MSQTHTKSNFDATLLEPAQPGEGAPWAFVVLPKDASEKLPRRGRTSVIGSMNGQAFEATLEPDGQLSHWLRVPEPLLKSTSTIFGDTAAFELMSADTEREPEVPTDLLQALEAAPEALAVWEVTTTIARVDWIHWVVTAKQAKTRAKRIADACDMLSQGKRRVCCFDPSGFYSKALSAPKAAK